jgi:hypothetical protein
VGGEARRRIAVALGVLGTVGIAIAAAAVGVRAYISEAGVPESGHSALYRWSVLAVAVSAAFTATLGLPRLTAVILAVGAPALAVSAAITCTKGCPLPPNEATTPSDLIHAAASSFGIALCALAMVTLAMRPGTSGRRNQMRLVSLVAVALAWPLLVATVIGIAVVRHSAFTGIVERLGVAVCLVWLISTAGLSGRTSAAER